MQLTKNIIAGLIDNTVLKANATHQDIENLCKETQRYNFFSVMVNGSMVNLCKKILGNSKIAIGSVVGFPLGQASIETKVFEAGDSISKGATEIDYVINVTEVKAANYSYIQKEMQQIVEVCKEKGLICKVILENCYLTDDEKKRICEIAVKTKIDFVKTSTGFGTGGATEDDVRLMKSIVGSAVKVKASGGIRDLVTFKLMVDAGAERIGTSSGVKIIEEFQGNKIETKTDY